MKNYIKVAAALALTFGLAGCDLDPVVTDNVTQERHDELIGNPETQPKVAKAALAKVYSIFQDFYSSHDDFGLKAFHIATDLMCEDVAYQNWNWFQFDYQIDNRMENYRRTRSTWGLFYDIIAKLNLHLETYFAQESDDPEVMASKGEALALRGISYFHLVNFYQHTYKGHEDALGVPLALKSTDENLPRATVKEVYAQIIEDLKYAVDHCHNTGVRTDVDRAVAAAYLAKAYAQMEDWANVKTYAVIAQEGGTDKVSEPARGWDIGQPDILWGYDINSQNSTLWASYWSHMDHFLPRGYAAGGKTKLIYNYLYNQIPKSDSRRKLWIDKDSLPEVAMQMLAQTHNSGMKKLDDLDNFEQVKFIAGEAGMEQDYCFIRVQDPILLEIEALVELGDLANAQAKLTAFASKRDPKFKAPTTQDELRKEVRFQRRIELWGEGTNWFDMKRWKETIDRTKGYTIKDKNGKDVQIVSNHKKSAQKVMRTDDKDFLHKLPIKEINANKNLVQNP